MDAVSTLRQIAYDLAKERESLEKILGSLKHIVVGKVESGLGYMVGCECQK
jgi:uncharacterized circularly permuted ATP-grasp superfamily protein